jgi:hypothetical protein
MVSARTAGAHMDEDLIAEFAERGGMTEDEARIFYHLEQARALYRNLPGRSNITNTIRFDSSWKTLIDMLGERVLHRDRPEVWGRKYLDPDENGPEDDQ